MALSALARSVADAYEADAGRHSVETLSDAATELKETRRLIAGLDERALRSSYESTNDLVGAFEAVFGYHETVCEQAQLAVDRVCVGLVQRDNFPSSGLDPAEPARPGEEGTVLSPVIEPIAPSPYTGVDRPAAPLQKAENRPADHDGVTTARHSRSPMLANVIVAAVTLGVVLVVLAIIGAL
jgi:hypothetical protein